MGYIVAVFAFAIAFFLMNFTIATSLVVAAFAVVFYFAISIVVFFCLLGSRRTVAV